MRVRARIGMVGGRNFGHTFFNRAGREMADVGGNSGARMHKRTFLQPPTCLLCDSESRERGTASSMQGFEEDRDIGIHIQPFYSPFLTIDNQPTDQPAQ